MSPGTWIELQFQVEGTTGPVLTLGFFPVESVTSSVPPNRTTREVPSAEVGGGGGRFNLSSVHPCYSLPVPVEGS